MKIDLPEMGVIITSIIAIVGLIIKFAPTKKKIDCKPDDCNRKFEIMGNTMQVLEKKQELQNTDVQLLKSNHNTHEKDIDGFRDDIRKIFDKIDDLKTVILQSMQK